MISGRMLSLIAASALAGCAGMSEQECVSLDWRTVGFEDGALGRPVSNVGSYRQACSKYGVASDLESYRAGHAAGVESYCRPARGFDVGRRGEGYHGVCPASSEREFLAAYNSGRHLHELESTLAHFENRIATNRRAQESIKHELTSIGVRMISEDTTTEDRLLLAADSAALVERFSALSGEIEALEKERLLSEMALRDYQETLAQTY